MAEKVIVIADSITVGELADKLNLPVTDLIGELFKNGIVSTINQRIDFETASIIIEELGLKDVELERKNTTSLATRKVHELSELAVISPRMLVFFPVGLVYILPGRKEQASVSGIMVLMVVLAGRYGFRNPTRVCFAFALALIIPTYRADVCGDHWGISSLNSLIVCFVANDRKSLFLALTIASA